MTGPRRVNPLRHRDFRLLFWGQTASNFGSNAVMVAMAIYITRTTGSPTDLGLILAAQTVPFVLLLLFGGVWADRLPRHRVMVVTDLIRGALHAVLAVLILAGVARVWQIAAIEFMFGAAWAFFQPAYTGLLPQTVPEDQIQAARALIEGSWNVTLVLGPAIATVLVLAVGAGEAFAADAGTFLISALTLMEIRPRVRGAAATESRQSVAHELRAGFREVASRPWVWVTIAAFSLVVMCSFATWEALGPAAVRDVYGHVGVFGVLVALFGVGSVAGSLLATRWHPRRPLRDMLATAAMWPAMSIVVAVGPPRGVVAAWMLIAGVQSGMFMVIWETALAKHIPPDALSRVSSYDWMGSLALLPVGFVLAGPLAASFGVRPVLGVGGGIGVLAVFLALIPRSTRELTDEPPTERMPEPDVQPSSSRARSA
ncbi:MAG: MFS transporter [Conexibacteraceae bacterium]|nr:MFS transporter [Conexibacteraceae bacterium]